MYLYQLFTTNVDKELFIKLSCTFTFFTVLGTISHEWGHYMTAKMLGYDARINYMSTWLTNSATTRSVSEQDYFLFILGGPVETISTGSIGVLLLFVFRKSFYASKSLSLPQWGIVFTSLFWLRQPANFAIWIVGFLLTGKFSSRSDEVMLSRMLNIPDATLSATTAVIGVTVLTVILFNFIPFSQRLTFVLSGLLGGITGYLLWLKVLGKYIMP